MPFKRMAVRSGSTPGPTDSAWAPTGKVHPPPNSARNARSDVTRAAYPGIVDGGQGTPGDVVVLAALHGQRPLPHLRQHRPGVEHLELEPGRWGPAQPVERGLGHHNCTHCTVPDCARTAWTRTGDGQPGGQIPAQSGEGEVGTEVGQLDPPAGRAGGHRGPDGQRAETATDQHVTRHRPARGTQPVPIRAHRAQRRREGPWPNGRRRRPHRR